MKNLVGLSLILPFLLLPVSASAAALSCSIHPKKDTPDSELAGLAKLSQDDAKKAALASIKAASDTAAEGELEVERGCLVYSFDVKSSGHSGVEEVWIDAGTGKVLSHKHESRAKEAAEKVFDKDQSQKTY